MDFSVSIFLFWSWCFFYIAFCAETVLAGVDPYFILCLCSEPLKTDGCDHQNLCGQYSPIKSDSKTYNDSWDSTFPLHIFFVNRVRIYKDKDTTLPQKIPPPLELTHPGVKLVYIPKLITEVNCVCVMIVRVIHIKMKKVSITYHIWFAVIHLAYFMNSFNVVTTNRDKLTGLVS